MGTLIDLSGKTFGRLTVICRSKDDNYINGEALWVCKCSCAKQSILSVCGSQLRQDKKKSCGCIWKPEKEEFLKKIKERLVKYSKLNVFNQCIEWTGCKDKGGYGHIGITKNGIERPVKAHRASWLVHVGDIPNDKFVCHHCDNPCCIRLEHLFLGSHTDNMRDKNAKRRGNYRKGEESGVSKITQKQAKKILKMKDVGITSTEIGKKYNIAASTVRSIWQRKNWKHL